MDIMEIIRSRHSVRQYINRSIEQEKRNTLDALAEACNAESGLHIQIIYDEPKCFQSLLSKVAKFSGCSNYIAIVGNSSDAMLEEKAGYYGEKLVLKAQEIGLNTCWVGFSHGKCDAKLENGESLVIAIALGYGANQGVERKSKSLEDVSVDVQNLPEWYVRGVQAALLAPTATNQQRFRIELNGTGTDAIVTATDKGYAKIDLGIVKYHFEIASGHLCMG